MLNKTYTLATLFLAAALIGCGNSGGDGPPAGSGTDATKSSKKPDDTKPAKIEVKDQKLAFITNNASDYWTIARKGVEKAEKELGIKVEFKMPAAGTAAEQRQIIDDLTAKGLNGMAISPVDPANQTDVLNSAAAKALVITQDSDAPKSNRSWYIGTDNFAAGKQAGEELKKSLPNGGKVMIFVGKSDAQNAKDRIGGLKDAIKGSKIEVVDVRTDDADHAKAKTNVADTLTKYPDIAGLVGIWSYNGPAILSAVKDASKVGKVKIVCFDEENDTLAGIKEGSIDATVVQQPFEFGYQAVIMMSKYIAGDMSVVPANKLDYIPTLVLHKDTVDAFKEKLAKQRAGG